MAEKRIVHAGGSRHYTGDGAARHGAQDDVQYPLYNLPQGRLLRHIGTIPTVQELLLQPTIQELVQQPKPTSPDLLLLNATGIKIYKYTTHLPEWDLMWTLEGILTKQLISIFFIFNTP